jgi:hypothetical protein
MQPLLQNCMPLFPYRATNFSGAFTQLNGDAQIEVTWAQLVWAAITAGKAAGDEYAYGIYSALERLHRASMIRAYLLEGSSARLFQTIPYETSDPSEKTSISFYLGMTLAKLFAEVLFDVPRMLHVAVYGQNYQIATGQGGSRPDLVGLSTNDDWFVFEAKGRSNGFDINALNTAKEQAEQIISIGNVAPVCNIATQSFFSANGLRFRMHDPEPHKSSRSRSLNISRDKFEHDYYDPMRSIVVSRGSEVRLEIAGNKFRGARIAEADFVVALAADQVGAQIAESAADLSSSYEYLGKDGILIQLGSSWSQANMRLQPHLRSN